MPVQLIVDCFGIDDQPAETVDTTNASIDAARHAIYQNLRSKDDTVLRIRLMNPALFKHFREFEGIPGFAVQRVIPRQLLTERFKTALPAWLTDDSIVALGLLKNNPIPALAFDEQLIIACHPDLLNGRDFYAFIAALNQQSAAFLLVLAEKTIKERLIQHLRCDLKIDKEAAELFITYLVLDRKE